MTTIDAGDTVEHGPTGEIWDVACVDGDRLSPAGWPPTLAKLEDCALKEKATPEKRREMLRAFALMGPDRHGFLDHRTATARRILAAEGVEL